MFAFRHFSKCQRRKQDEALTANRPQLKPPGMSIDACQPWVQSARSQTMRDFTNCSQKCLQKFKLCSIIQFFASPVLLALCPYCVKYLALILMLSWIANLGVQDLSRAPCQRLWIATLSSFSFKTFLIWFTSVIHLPWPRERLLYWWQPASWWFHWGPHDGTCITNMYQIWNSPVTFIYSADGTNVNGPQALDSATLQSGSPGL